MTTLVLGLGNPILRDDGVGWAVVRLAEDAWRCRIGDAGADGETGSSCGVPSSASVEFDCFSCGGLALMERLIGYNRAVLVDAIQTRDGVPGTLYRLALDDLPTLHGQAATLSAHDAPLKAALELGRRLGLQLPDALAVIAIEVENIWEFGEGLSLPVTASLGRAVEMVLAELEA